MLSYWRQFILGLFLLLTVLTFSLLAVFDYAAQPMRQARTRAEKLAKTYTDLKKVDHFAVFNHQTSYYSLDGKTASGDRLAVLIPEEGGDIFSYELDQGVTRTEAAEVAVENGAEITGRVILGQIKGQPVWEVNAGKVYYYIDFETGDLVSKEGL